MAAQKRALFFAQTQKKTSVFHCQGGTGSYLICKGVRQYNVNGGAPEEDGRENAHNKKDIRS